MKVWVVVDEFQQVMALIAKWSDAMEFIKGKKNYILRQHSTTIVFTKVK